MNFRKKLIDIGIIDETIDLDYILKHSFTTYEIGGCCGSIGADFSTVIDWIRQMLRFSHETAEKYVSQLPSNVGIFHNYLGGGIKGALCYSDIDHVTNKKVREYLFSYQDFCKRVFTLVEAEEEDYYDGEPVKLPETYPDGDTNWDNMATNRSREAGIVSAY
jgi:hypothetical protein